MLKRTLLLALLLTTASPAHAVVSGDAQTADDILREPARSVLEAVPAGVHDKNASAAFAARAYLSAIALAADATVMPEQARAWEDVQDEPDPPQAFLQYVLDEWHAAGGILEDALGLLGNASAEVGAREAGPLMVAAHMLVQAEINHDLAGRFLTGSAESDYVRTADQRYAFLRPVVLAGHGAAVAVQVIEAAPSGGSAVDLATIDAAVDEAGGALHDEFPLPEAGALHRLARHVVAYESSIEADGIPGLAQAAADLDRSRGSWDPSVPQDRAAVVSLDVAWWLQRAEQVSFKPENLNPLLSTLQGYVEGAEYEAAILEEATPDREDGMLWAWVGAGAAVAAGAAIALAIYMRRRSSRHTALAWLPAALVAAAMLQAPAAEAQGLPGDPAESPVDITFPDHGGGWGNLAMGGSVARLVWTSCLTEGEGCRDVWTRQYDASGDGWSEATLLWDGVMNMSAPRLVAADPHDHLFWNEVDGGGIRIQWCLLDGDCDPVALSDLAADAGNLAAAATPDGRVNVVWQEEFPETSRIVFQQYDGTWGPTVLFDTTSASQRHPTIDVDSTGRSHLAWQESVSPDDKNHVGRTLHYATVDAAGQTASPSQKIPFLGLDTRTRPSVAVGDNDMVGLAFNNFRDTYFQEKPAGGAMWSETANVSRTNVPGSQSALNLMPKPGGEWVLTYRTGTVDEMRLWRADRAQGTWLAPHVMVGSPFDEYIISPSGAFDAPTGLHLTWTKPATDDGPEQMYYHLAAPSPAQGPPPEIIGHAPKTDAWVRGPDMEVQIHFLSSAPLDMDKSALRIDGADIPLTLERIRHVPVLVASAQGLGDGSHEAEATLVDQEGQSATSTWTFQTDSSTPRLDLSWRVDDATVPDVSGWQRVPVAFEARAVDEAPGSPSRVELSTDDGFTYHVLETVAPSLGMRFDDGAWFLPENRSLELRFRARDDAGNTQTAPPIEVGWDGTPPHATFDVPTWSTGSVRVSANVSDPTGSPVTIHIQLLDAQDTTLGSAEIGGSGETTFASIPEGLHTVRADVTDEAGNRMEPGPGPWQTRVDGTAPSVHATAGGLEAADASGLARVVVTAGGEIVLDAEPGGATAWSRDLEWPAGADRLRAEVTDVAGNVWTGHLDPVAGAVEDLPEVSSEDAEDLGSTDRGDQKSPAPAVWLPLAVAAALLRRRHA